jgi:hypothetical protein
MNRSSRTKLFNLTALALVLTLVMPWAAFADGVAVDGDTIAAGNDISYSTTSAIQLLVAHFQRHLTVR